MIDANRGAPTPPIPFGGTGPITRRLPGRVVELDDGFIARLRATCADVSTEPSLLAEAGRDWWPLAMTWAVDGQAPALAGAVARPSLAVGRAPRRRRARPLPAVRRERRHPRRHHRGVAQAPPRAAGRAARRVVAPLVRGRARGLPAGAPSGRYAGGAAPVRRDRDHAELPA